MRHPPNVRSLAAKHYSVMETLRTLTRQPEPTQWAKAIWPMVAVAVAAALDQSTRGPSIATMLLTAALG